MDTSVDCCCCLVSFKAIDESDDSTHMGGQFDRLSQEDNNNSTPFFLGTIEEAAQQAFHAQPIEDVRLAVCR
jgi:hypothetical protein